MKFQYRYVYLVFSISTILALLSAMPTTNASSRSIIEPFRVLALTMSVTTFVPSLGSLKGFKPIYYFSAYAFISFYWAYGYLRALALGTEVTFGEVEMVAIYLSLCGFVLPLTLLRLTKREQSLIIGSVVGFGLTSLIGTYVVGGMAHQPPFAFNLTYLERQYSQNITAFFGFCAICSSMFYDKNRSDRFWFAYLILSVIFVYFSFMGGARGDFIATFLVLLVVLFSRFPKISVFGSGMAVIFANSDVIAYLANNFTIGRRFSRMLSDGGGERVELLRAGHELLSNELSCLLFGCGFYYFQSNAGRGKYPHNFVIELIITHGILFMIIFLTNLVWSIFVLTRSRGGFRLLGVGAAFFSLIALKSGTVVNSFAFLLFSFSMVSFSFLLLSSKRSEGPMRLN